MADTIITNSMTGGAVFSGAPVIINVVAGDFPEESSFRMAVLEVTGNGRTIPFHQEVTRSQETAVFDIQSALRSLIDTASVKPGITYYPAVNFVLQARVEYLLDGELVAGSNYGASGRAIMGGLTIYERLTAPRSARQFLQQHGFSTKPRSVPEVALAGMQYYTHAIDDRTDEVVCTGYHLTAGVNTMEGRSVYACTFAELESYAVLCFVNRRGVLETILAQGTFAESYDFERKEHTVTPAPAWSVDTLFGSTVEGGRKSISMSSGPVDHAWAEWWATEFCMAQRIWLLHENHWWPVTVDVKSVTTRDRSKQEGLSVEFKVSLS